MEQHMSSFRVNEPFTSSQEAMPPPQVPSRSQRAASTASTASTASAVSWEATPDPPSRILLSIEQSSLSTTSTTLTPEPACGALSRDEKILLFKLAIKYKKGYFHKQKKVFWNNIQREFKQETKKVHKTLWRVVEQECTNRKKLLEQVGSGDEQYGDPFTSVVDQWIEVVKEKEQRQKDAKKGDDELANEAKVAHQDRLNLLLPRGKKTSRKRSLTTPTPTQDEDSNNDSGLELSDTKDPRQELTAPPESPPKRKHARKSQYTTVLPKDPNDERFLSGWDVAVKSIAKGSKIKGESYKRIVRLEDKVELYNTTMLEKYESINTTMLAIFDIVKGKAREEEDT